ncbi:regulatory protein RecX [Treponema sp. R6D11]
MRRPKDLEYAKWLSQYYLSYRMHTRREIMEKLHKKEIEWRIIYECLDFLEENKFIDDYDYTTRYIKDSVNLKKHGKNKIYQKLFQKGIKREVFENAYSELEDDIDNKQNILCLIEKKNPSLETYKDKQKLTNYLSGRGYAYGDIKEAIDEFTQQNNIC